VPALSAGVSAVELNITATDTTANSFFTVWPDGQAQPLASNLNWVSGEAIANRVIVPVSQSNGEIDVYNLSGDADLVVDVDGWFSGSTYAGTLGNGFVPIMPERVSDTRPGSGQPNEASPLGAGGTENVQITGTGGLDGVPAEDVTPVTAADINVTEATSSAGGYLTVYPAIDLPPVASDVNFVAGDVIANSEMVGLSPSGEVGIYNYTGTTNVVVDVFGYFTPVLQDTVAVTSSATNPIAKTTGTTTLTITVTQGTADVPGDTVVVSESGTCGTFSDVSNSGATNMAGTEAVATTPASGQVTVLYTAGAAGSCTVTAGELETDSSMNVTVTAA